MSKTSYQYQPLTGPLPGASFERQTVRFLNEVGGRADDAVDTAQQAGVRAGQAVGTASTALGMASAANGKATEAQASAAGAEKAAVRAQEAAEAAQNAADQGVSDAAAAKNAADAAATAARTAQSTAEQGVADAEAARTAAQAAHAAADDAQATAFAAQNAADQGIGDAAMASAAASAAQTTADHGVAAAQAAQASADAAQETADGKVSQALDDAVGVLPEANGGTGRPDGKAAALATPRTIALTGDVTGSAVFDGSADAAVTVVVGDDSHTHGDATITGLDAGKITSGVIDIARLPQGALERLIVVADDAARFALTAAEAQTGDTVKVVSTGVMYYVTNDAALSSEAGYAVYTAGAATTAAGCTGNAATATKLQTARTLTLSGGATGTAAAFDGSADVAVSVTALDMSAAATGVLSVARGGTGATDAAAARAALGIGAASTASAGIVRLNDTVTSTAADQAATANAARLAHDKGVVAENAAQAAQNAANWAQTHMWPVTHVGSWFLDASWNNEQGNFIMQAHDVNNGTTTLPVRVARADYADNGGGGGLLSQLSLGTLLPWRSTALAAGLVWANGDAVYLNDWPEFRTMYQAGGLNGMVLPEGTTAAVRAANRGKWTLASGGTALLTPDMRGQFLRGQCPGYGNAGVWQTDAIRNITGWIENTDTDPMTDTGRVSQSGALSYNTPRNYNFGPMPMGPGGYNGGFSILDFNASRSVPTGSENVPPHVWTPVAIYMGNHA